MLDKVAVYTDPAMLKVTIIPRLPSDKPSQTNYIMKYHAVAGARCSLYIFYILRSFYPTSGMT